MLTGYWKKGYFEIIVTHHNSDLVIHQMRNMKTYTEREKERENGRLLQEETLSKIFLQRLIMIIITEEECVKSTKNIKAS